MKRKLVAMLMALTLIGGLVSGCGSGTATASAGGTETAKQEKSDSGDKVNLSFYIWNDEEKYIRQVVDQYNASQDKVNVDLTVIPSEDYDDKLKVLLAGDSDVDLVDIRGMAQVTTYATSDALLDITDKIKNSNLDTSKYGEMWNGSSVDNKFYALPTRSTCWALYYNADLFDKAGIPYPKQLTWEQYGDIAKEIKEKTGVYGGYWVPWIFQFAATQAGQYVNGDDLSKVSYSLQLLDRFYNKDQSHMSYSEIAATNPDYISEFASGRAAMLPNGEWCVQMLMEKAKSGESNINWQVAPMPVSDGVEPGSTWGQFQFASITKNSKHPDEAFDFLKYLCGEEGSVIYSQNGMIHAYASDNAEETYKKAAGRDSVSVFFDSKKVLEQPNEAGYGEIADSFNEQAQLYLLGEKSLDDTMKDFAAKRDEIKAKYAK